MGIQDYATEATLSDLLETAKSMGVDQPQMMAFFDKHFGDIKKLLSDIHKDGKLKPDPTRTQANDAASKAQSDQLKAMEQMSKSVEKTLGEILNALKKNATTATNKTFGYSSSGAAAQSDPYTSKNMEGLLKAASKNGMIGSVFSDLLEISPAVGMIVKTLTGLGKIISGIWNATINTMKIFGRALIDLTDDAISGKLKVSKFFDMFTDLPFGLGKIAGLFASLSRRLETNLEKFQELTRVGATFGGSLNDVARSALNSFLPLEEYSSEIAKNASTLATFGGTVEKGRKQFEEAQHYLMDPNGELFGGLAELGINASESARLLMGFIKSNGYASKATVADSRSLSIAAADYMKQLTALSEITGKSRETQQEELNKILDEAGWKQFSSSLNESQSKVATQILTFVDSTLGSDQANSLKRALMTGLYVPLGDAGLQISASNGKMLVAMETLVKDFITTGSLTENGSRRLSEAIQETARNVGGPLNNAFVHSEQGLRSFGGQLGLVNVANKEHTSILDQVNKGLYGRASAEDDSAKKFAQAQQNLLSFGNKVGNGFYYLLDKVLSPFTRITSGMLGGLDKFAQFVDETFGNLESSTTMSEFFKTLADDIGTLFKASQGQLSDMLSYFKGVFGAVADYLGPRITNIFRNAIYEMLDYLHNNVTIGMYHPFGAPQLPIMKPESSWSDSAKKIPLMWDDMQKGLIAGEGSASNAVSSTGAKGRFQFLDSTRRDLSRSAGLSSPFDPTNDRQESIAAKLLMYQYLEGSKDHTWLEALGMYTGATDSSGRRIPQHVDRTGKLVGFSDKQWMDYQSRVGSKWDMANSAVPNETDRLKMIADLKSELRSEVSGDTGGEFSGSFSTRGGSVGEITIQTLKDVHAAIKENTKAVLETGNRTAMETKKMRVQSQN